MIGMVLFIIVIRLYLISEKSTHLQQALTHIQDDAHDAIYILTSEIKKAGNIGCARLTSDFPVAAYREYTLTAENKRIVHDHELIIRYMDYPHASLLKITNHSLWVSNHAKFLEEDILVISDCKHAEMFQVAQIKMEENKQKLITTSPLKYHYEKNAEISRLQINRYFIDKTRRTYSDGSSIYALFVETKDHRKLELVANISAIQFTRDVQSGVNISLQVTSPPFKKQWYAYAA
jgi:hypothetical protein